MRKNLYRNLAGLILLCAGGLVFAGAQTESTSAPPMASDEMSGESGAMADPGGYLEFDEALFNASAEQTRIYFFHAGWCPTCRALDRDINRNLDRIPSDIVIFKTDYDTTSELKTRFGVTYQHTLVVVDANGELVRKWTGGDFDDILEHLAEI